MKKHRAIRYLMATTVLFIQIAYLALIVKEKYKSDNFTAILSVVFISLLILFGHRYLDLHHEEFAYEKFSVVIWVPIGAVLCYQLKIYTDLNSVLSAGIIGTIASFIPDLNEESNYLKDLPPAIYCGVFVGMSSAEITPSIGVVLFAGIVAGVFFLLSKNLFIGIGGKLGTIAFVGVAVVSVVNWLLV